MACARNDVYDGPHGSGTKFFSAARILFNPRRGVWGAFEYLDTAVTESCSRDTRRGLAKSEWVGR